MQCHVCKFENMPKSLYCARCAAQLYIESKNVDDYLPPRAKRWKKWGSLKYFYNRICDSYNREEKSPTKTTEFLPFESMAAMVLSIFPGLGHLVYGKKKHSLLCLAVWFILLIAIIFLYGSFGGTIALAMIVFWHCMAIFHVGEVRKHFHIVASRLVLMGIVFTILTSGYFAIHSYADEYFKVVISPSSYNNYNIEKADSLLVQKTTLLDVEVENLVIVHSTLARYERRYVYVNIPKFSIGLVLAKSGSTVDISREDGIQVDGKNISLKTFSLLKAMLPKDAISLKIPKDHVLIPMMTNVVLPDAINAHVWRKIYIVQTKNIWGKPIAVYFPLSKRHFFGG